MLKALFSSNTRIKLLTTFLLNPDEEYFIRELTRKLDEQINSIRRELDNLKKIGLLRSKTRNRKKYYIVDKNFLIFNELKTIILKTNHFDEDLVRGVSRLGDVEFMILSGMFVGKEGAQADMLVVGDIDKNKLQSHLNESTKGKKEVKFSLLSKTDFLYRIEMKDKFIHEMLTDESNVVAVNKLKDQLKGLHP